MIDVGTPEPMPTGTGEDVGEKTVESAVRLGYSSLTDYLRARIDMGERKYNTRLRTHNGRNSLKDLLEELLDAAQYAQQYQMENPDVPSTEYFLFKALKLAAEVKRNLNEK